MKPAPAKQSITAAEAFEQIEAREIDVTHWPKREHPPWRAACFIGEDHFEVYADMPLEAVERLLRKIGESE